nr:DNA cytosine methyltransferase [Rosenbergiella epipactidis]
MRLAGIPDDYPCWTGSPPCQPFSTAGKQLGQLDERHLAPTFMRLVDECKPAILFGEQVAAAIGKHWLDDLFNELERQGYACGAAVLPACSVGAPHKRDRLFFGAKLVVHANNQCKQSARHEAGLTNSSRSGMPSNYMADTSSSRHLRSESTKAKERWQSESEQIRELSARPSRCPISDFQPGTRVEAMADAKLYGFNTNEKRGGVSKSEIKGWMQQSERCDARVEVQSLSRPHKIMWSSPDWLGCRDGKFRPVEPGTFPLANGIPARVGRLRGYGNAIVPQVAAEFIGAFMESIQDSECNVCGFPSEDDRWCEACEAVYQAKDPNYYDLGGSDAKAKTPMQDMP